MKGDASGAEVLAGAVDDGTEGQVTGHSPRSAVDTQQR